jgi:hypothetical protein
MSDTDQVYAQNRTTSPTHPYNAQKFAMEVAQNGVMTCTIVKVLKVTTNNAVAAIGRVNVQPLVQMVDGIQRTTDHETVFNLPYIRMVGGKCAVIIDPQEGDIGIVVSCDRDISGVKNSKKVSPPGSGRKYNIADGIFIGCAIADKPTSYVRFDSDRNIELSPDGGVTSVWVSPNRVDLGMKNAPHAVVTVDGPSQKVFAVIDESGSGD